MKKIIFKIFIIFILATFIVNITNIYAASGSDSSSGGLSGVINGGKNFIKAGNENKVVDIEQTELGNVSGDVYYILLAIAIL